MTKFFALSTLVAALTLVSCSDFLDSPTNDSSQTLFFDGGELTKSSFSALNTPRDVFFIDKFVGITVGDFGYIFKTDNSGANWQKQTSGTNLPLVSVMFINAQIGFASGFAFNCNEGDCNKGSPLLKTTDGGKTWSKTLFTGYEAIFNVHFFDTQTALAIIHPAGGTADDYYLARTTDGGSVWTPLDVAIRSPHVFQVIGNMVLAAGEQQLMFRSNDRGLTWETVATPVPASRDLRGLYFFDKNLGFADDSTQVYRTINGGASWDPVATTFKQLGVVHFWDENDGINFVPIPTGGTVIYVTSNGGQTWGNVAGSDSFTVITASFPGEDVGYGISLSEFYTIRNR